MRRWARRIFVLAALILLLSYFLGSIDFWRVKNGKSPIFVLNWEGFFDGGTFAGCGLGYTIYLNDGVGYSMRKGKIYPNFNWAEGPEINFWFLPFLNKSEVSFKPFERNFHADDGK